MRTTAYLTFLALTLPSLCSCVDSKFPLSDETTSTIDKRLLGTWVELEDEGQIDTTFFARKPGTKNTMELVSLQLNKDHTIKIERVTIYVLAGNTSFLSMQKEKKKKGNDSEYLIMKYDLPDENTLRLYHLKLDVFKQAIEEGKLKGILIPDESVSARALEGLNDQQAEPKKIELKNIEPKKPEPKEAKVIKSATLTDTPEAILKFLEAEGSKCYEKPLTLYRRLPDFAKQTKRTESNESEATIHPSIVIAIVITLGLLAAVAVVTFAWRHPLPK